MHSTVNGRMAGRNESGLLSEGVIHLEKKVSSKFIFFFGSFAGILFGYDIGIIAGAEGHIQEEFQAQPVMAWHRRFFINGRGDHWFHFKRSDGG